MSAVALRLTPRFEVGIAPYWILAPVAVLAALPPLISGRQAVSSTLSRLLRWAAFSLVLFAIYGAVSAFSLPFVFHGTAVLNPRLGIAAQFRNPSSLSWSLSNAGQAGYIVLNCMVFCLLIARLNNRQDLRAAHGCVLAAGWLVVGFAVFQHFSTAYLPNQLYPALYAITHNNPAASSYPLMDPRTTSFFLEPSYLGGFAAMLLAIGLSGHFLEGRRTSLALALIATYVILTSESTIGLALIVFGLILGLLAWIRSGATPPDDGRKHRTRSRIMNAFLGLLCAAILFSGEQATAALLRPAGAPALRHSSGTGALGSPVAPAASPEPTGPSTPVVV
jgi:hypothetical protein